MKGDDVVVLAASLAWGLVIAVTAYAIMRAAEFILHPDPSPGVVTWSAHAGYYWRIWTVAYAGGIAAFVMLVVTRGRLECSARGLILAVRVSALLLALQVALFP